MYYLIFNENGFFCDEIYLPDLFNNIGRVIYVESTLSRPLCYWLHCLVALIAWSMRTMPNLWQREVDSGNTIRFLLDPDPIDISFIVSLCAAATRVASVLINHYKRIGRSRLFDPHLIMSWCLTQTVLKSNKQSCNSGTHFIRCKTFLAALIRCF